MSTAADHERRQAWLVKVCKDALTEGDADRLRHVLQVMIDEMPAVNVIVAAKKVLKEYQAS